MRQSTFGAANSRASLAGRASLAPSKQQPADGADMRNSRGMSLGGRRSSVAPGANGRKPADPRNISEKGFKERSIRKLITYLCEHGYDRALSPQILTAPSTKDFVHILSFLLKKSIPNFQFGKKFEDEVPVVLKALGYPYNISKGALTAVGSPHTWPHLLAALVWLVDLLKYSDAAFKAEQAEAAFDSEDGNKIFFDYLAKGYALYLSGEDDLSPLDEELAFMFESKNAAYGGDIESLTAANADLAAQLAELTTGGTPLQRAQAANALLKADETKYGKHFADVSEHRGKMNAKLAAHRAEAAESEAELGALLGEIEGHKATVAAQGITPSDVRRMHSEREHLESELASIKTHKDALSKQGWDEEVAIGKAADRLEAKAQQANNAALRLQLVPADAKNARGVDHQIVVQKENLSVRPEALLSVDALNSLVPSLQRVKVAVVHELNSSQDTLLEAEEAETKREFEQQERVDTLAALKGKLARLEAEEKRTREAHARELDERTRETEALREQIVAARSATGASLVTSQSDLVGLQKEYAAFQASSSHAREKMYSQLVSALDMLTLHKEHIETQLQGLKDYQAKKMEAVHALLQE